MLQHCSVSYIFNHNNHNFYHCMHTLLAYMNMGLFYCKLSWTVVLNTKSAIFRVPNFVFWLSQSAYVMQVEVLAAFNAVEHKNSSHTLS